MKLIEVRDLYKAYGSLKAVDGVSFNVNAGEVFGLLGPNGAGKSTLISMVTTLARQDKGEIYIEGNDINKKSKEAKRSIGLVPQEIALYPTLTARENLMFWGRMYGLGGKSLGERVNEALEIAGLTDRQKDRIDSYSGGMKRRINIAAALLHKPKVLVMDEPTVGIDPQSRNHILETVLKLNKEGMTIIYTSHYMEEVEFLCTRIAIMDHGKIIASGSKEELRKLAGEFDIINIDVSNASDDLEGMLKSIEGVSKVSMEQNTLKVYAKDSGTLLAKVISALDSKKSKIHNIGIEETNLETVFLHLTGRALRD
ncbi:MAG TPA: ABC transporter ATP-binding protein [Pseudobacteroides sp.]|uniref:ABC transporter ATP-binding protein n=1 Tax=Pseudobacteroides sp. TaxID=1968840 RepID=UPI002F935B08